MDPFKNACLKAGGNCPNFVEFPNYFLADIHEGLGSLNKLADDIYQKTDQNFYYQVGWGNAASIINDLAACGAKPLTIKLFLAVGNERWFSHQQRWQNIIQGFREAAKYSGAAWNGGETQTLVDIIDKQSSVLAGSAVGIVKPKSHLLVEEKIEPGDRIILLSSSGVHTNGITLIRKIFKNDILAEVETVRHKTVIYSPLISQILNSGIEVHYASHITGHGWRKIIRAKRPFSYIIDKTPRPQPIFEMIQQVTGMSDAQMYSDFNMGAGFALFAPEKSTRKILQIAKKFRIPALDAGVVKEGPRKLIITPLGIEFAGDSLQIR